MEPLIPRLCPKKSPLCKVSIVSQGVVVSQRRLDLHLFLVSIRNRLVLRSQSFPVFTARPNAFVRHANTYDW